MRADRSVSASIRSVSVFLVILLVATDCPASGPFTVQLWGASLSFETNSHKLAKAVAKKAGEVRDAFEEKRQALKIVSGPDGRPAYPVEALSGLIAHTSEDLDKALEEVGEPRLESLNAWATEELSNIQERLAANAPVKVATVARLGHLPLPAAAPKPSTVPASTADQLLDEAKAVLERIFVLASNRDLEVELWVGSAPSEKATFRFWPQGQLQGAAPEDNIIETNGKRKHVLRGLYFYRAALTDGAVTELITYPGPAGATGAGIASERLDLVNGSSFVCCRFDQKYCQHISDKEECLR